MVAPTSELGTLLRQATSTGAFWPCSSRMRPCHTQGYRATIGLRLRGEDRTLEVDLPRPYYATVQVMPRDEEARLELKALVDQAHDNDAVAEELNRRGRADAHLGDPFTARRIEAFRSTCPAAPSCIGPGFSEQGYRLRRNSPQQWGSSRARCANAHRKRGIEACRFKVAAERSPCTESWPTGPADNSIPTSLASPNPSVSNKTREWLRILRLPGAGRGGHG